MGKWLYTEMYALEDGSLDEWYEDPLPDLTALVKFILEASPIQEVAQHEHARMQNHNSERRVGKGKGVKFGFRNSPIQRGPASVEEALANAEEAFAEEASETEGRRSEGWPSFLKRKAKDKKDDKKEATKEDAEKKETKEEA